MNGLGVVFVFTHDSICVGEDGPTHQPIEHLASLRAMPGLHVVRPCDAAETRAAWKHAAERSDGPTTLVLSRQNLPVLDRTELAPAEGLTRGAYVLADAPDGEPRAILIATGSEVHLALAAREELARSGVGVRVVSMPSWELFADQDRAWRDQVLPPGITQRVSIEAGSTMGWERWIGASGLAIGIDRFGASAPGPTLEKELGFTAERVVQGVRALLGSELSVQD